MSDYHDHRVRRLFAADEAEELFLIWCPGCKRRHPFRTQGSGPKWRFNGDLLRPTFTPSLLCNRHSPEDRCHSFVTDGRIRFLADCHHELAGQTIDLLPYRDWPY